jgi:hypothetical protein
VNIHVVLDTSALIAYARLDTLAVGEMIKEVGDSGGTIGVPAPAFATAYAAVDPAARKHLLRLLETDAYTLVLPMLADDLADVAELTTRLPLPLAHAVSQARQWNASLATFEPALVAHDLDPLDVFDLGQ